MIASTLPNTESSPAASSPSATGSAANGANNGALFPDLKNGAANRAASGVPAQQKEPAAQSGQPTTPDVLSELQNAILAGNIPQLVTSALSHAINLRSSDVHIEPEQSTVRLRYRVDGVLRQIVEYPTNIHPAVVSRIKIMSNLKIDEQRIPQDGRAQVTTPDGREMDLRVSTLPTVNGEKVVMRIQERTREIPSLEELGLGGTGLEFIKKTLALPNGIILTSGPTGSGKTTTLYSSLTILNKIDVNILTFEDPVEIQMDGLSQSQVHPDIEYDFARGLRAALRQDPDIMMVGEIRDRETIDVAIEAALTGHLVLSTIHTNSAVETLTRIDNMGVPPFLMTATINTIIAQRLVRRLCQTCKKPTTLDEATRVTVKRSLDHLTEAEKKYYDASLFEQMTFFEAVGCAECDNAGYKGRVGLYEVLQMNNELRTKIINRASVLELEQTAIENGMVTLEQSGILRALLGETTLSEVYRVARPMEI